MRDVIDVDEVIADARGETHRIVRARDADLGGLRFALDARARVGAVARDDVAVRIEERGRVAARGPERAGPRRTAR